MTRVIGRNVFRTTCCGTFVSSTAFGSINLMAYEYWTDGRKVGSLMPEDGGLRECSCGEYFLIGDCERVMTLENPKPIAPENWQSIKSNWWTKLMGKPTKADILLHYDTRSKQEIDTTNLCVPDSKHVPDASMPKVFNQEKASKSLLIAARRRYWRYLNDGQRDVYRNHRKIYGQSFPSYQVTVEQADNMFLLIELLQKPYSSNWIEVAELYRELGDYKASIDALSEHRGTKTQLSFVVGNLAKLSISSPARYRLHPDQTE